jgi:hypothetical protein
MAVSHKSKKWVMEANGLKAGKSSEVMNYTHVAVILLIQVRSPFTTPMKTSQVRVCGITKIHQL